MKWMSLATITCAVFAVAAIAKAGEADVVKVLIVDGQNNHRWKETTPVLKRIFGESERFSVEVATSPPKGEDLSNFQPEFHKYDVVVSNYNGDLWSEETRQAFVEYVSGGGGFVAVHAANNSFPKWNEYNEMIGLGGWGGRNEESGPYIRFRDGEFVKDETPGRGGAHGNRHKFQVIIHDKEHPITRGLPTRWMHAQDELYDRLRGPAKNLHVLATAYSDPSTRGSGEHEPMLMTISYGKGRVFHTTLGHDVLAMSCVGFIETLKRGTEWAATGDVTQSEIPKDFPTADESRTRDLSR